MEFDENNIVEEQDEEAVEIYSRRAIFWFSLVASPLFGSILLIINLRAAGYKKAVNAVLAFIILFEVIGNVVMLSFIKIYKVDLLAYQKLIIAGNQDPKAYDPNVFILLLMILVFKIIGSFTLSRYLFMKYFPEDDYYPKGIGSALLFTVVGVLLLQVTVIGQYII